MIKTTLIIFTLVWCTLSHHHRPVTNCHPWLSLDDDCTTLWAMTPRALWVVWFLPDCWTPFLPTIWIIIQLSSRGAALCCYCFLWIDSFDRLMRRKGGWVGLADESQLSDDANPPNRSLFPIKKDFEHMCALQIFDRTLTQNCLTSSTTSQHFYY